MADNLDEVFSDETQDIPAEPITPDVAPEPEAEAPQPEQVAPEPVEPQQDGRFVPLAAVLDERDKRKALEARVAEFERIQQQAKPQNVPDAFDEPEQYTAYLQQQMGQAMAQQRMDTSYLIATQAYGKDTVEKAREWALERGKSNPGFAAELDQQAHPIDWIVHQHKRDGLISQLPDDVSSLDELVEREIAKRGLSAPVAAPSGATPQQAPQPVKVPRSLASQGSSQSDIRHVASGPLSAVDAVFT